MITIKLDDLEITTDSSHVATDYDVYEKVTNNLICSKHDCSGVEKNTIAFDYAVDLHTEYYVTIRVLLDTGWSEKTSHPLMITKDDNLVSFATRPVRVERVYKITTDCSDVNNHEITNFTITIPEFKSDGKAEHTYTTWIISDIDKKVVMMKSKDGDNLNSLHVTNDMVRLKENQVYRISAMVHSSTGDNSEMNSLTIKTKGLKHDI